MRLLYVALTRARDTLILAATLTPKKWEAVWAQPEPLTPQRILAANSFADWLGLWFSGQSPTSNVQTAAHGELPELRWRLVADAELAEGDTAESEMRPADIELPLLDATSKDRLQKMLAWQYPFDAATRRKAKSSVTELRRAAEEPDDEAEPLFARPVASHKKRKPESGKRKLSAAEFGTAHHKFLQNFALENAEHLPAEADRLVQENYLSAAESEALDLDALGEFWHSELGQKIRGHAEWVRRELPFTARFRPAELEKVTGRPTGAGLENEFIVVQGTADLVVLLPKEIWLVDFKTDAGHADDLAGKIKAYKPQLQLYAAALEKIFARKVTLRALHFFAWRRTEII